MRILRTLIVLGAAAASAVAQTNGPVREVRPLSLQDCVRLALQNNLQIRSDRYNPLVALYTLQGSFGAYDPTLFLSGEHDHNEAGPGLLGNGLVLPGSTTDSDIFRGSLGGLLPWGTTYSLNGGATDNQGTTPSAVDNPAQPILFTNSFVDINSGNTISYVTTNYAQMGVQRPFNSSSASATVSATQPLLRNFWIDSSRLVIRVNRNKLKQSEMDLKWQVMQTITTLEQAYYDLIYYREYVVVQKQAVELAERLVEENKRRLEVGAMAPLELQSAEAQAAQSRSAVIQAQSQLGTQERLVKRFISDDFASWVDVEIQPTESLTATHQYFDRQDSWAKALEQRPDLQSQRLSVESQGIQLKYNRNQLYPELDVFGSFGYNGAGKEFSDALYQVQQRDLPTYTFGGQISLPLANTSARKSYKAAKATLEQMLLGLKDNEQAIMSEVDNDIGTIQASYEQVLATRAAREYSEAALKAEQLKFQNGKSTLYTVLQMQRDLTSSRGDEIQALDNYNKLIARLSLNEGSTFERLGITWESK